MGYTNSPLVNYTRISPNRTSGRTCIDTITIHCVVGQCSVETLGNVFAPTSKRASSNYGVGYDGRIGMYVEEKDRSWCTSSTYNDNRAITIEVASDTTGVLAVRQAAYDSLIKLVVDICKRNGIKKLVWSTDKNTRMNHLNGCNMTVHRDYANKSCPGEWLYSRMGQIAAAVNAKLAPSPWVKENGEYKFRNPATGEFVADMWVGSSRGLWYYIAPDGKMAHNGLTFVHECKGINDSGVDQGTFPAGWFYFQPDNANGCIGAMKTGEHTIVKSTTDKVQGTNTAVFGEVHNGHFGACVSVNGKAVKDWTELP